MKERGIGTLATLVITTMIVASIIGGYYILQNSENNADKRVISITGSTTNLPITQAAAEVWMDEHPNDTINVSGGGSGDGIQAIMTGQAEIGNSSRPIREEEKERAQERGREIIEHRIAVDALAIVVHPENPVVELSSEEVKKIFAGEITNWKEVGGQNWEIAVYNREEGSGTRSTFEGIVMGDKEVTTGATTQASNGSMRQAISDNPQGIGYVGLGYVDDSLKAIIYDGVDASGETAASGEYPVSRFLYMYTDGEPTGLTRDFIDFILGEDGQEIVRQQGFVKITE